MKTLLLVLFATVSAFSQIPLSGEKEELKLDNADLNKVQSLLNTKFDKIPERLIPPELNSEFRFQYSTMPIKKVIVEESTMPVLELQSFDKMNADFYFKQKRATISNDTKTSLYRYRFR